MRRPRVSRLLPIMLVLSLLFAALPARPVRAATTVQAHKVAAGSALSLAVRGDGTVWGWGSNAWNQVGRSLDLEVHYPVQVDGLNNVVSVVAHQQGLALKSDGTVWSWGTQDKPTAIPGLTGITAVAGGGMHSLALKNDGTVWAWGYRTYGALGDGKDSGDTDTPVQALGLSHVVAIGAGDQFSVALTDTGRVYTWGNNDVGQLGTGTAAKWVARPQLVTALDSVTAVSTYWKHVVALRKDGTVWVWGDNSSRQLGNAISANRPTPIKVAGLAGVTSISASQNYSAAVKSDGTVWLWGTFRFETKAAPWQVRGLPPVVDVATGYNHILAPQRDGTLWAYGENRYGVLGVGDDQGHDQPVRVLPLTVDTTPPTWTNGQITVEQLGDTYVKLSWSGASDLSGVPFYRIYTNDFVTHPAVSAATMPVTITLTPETDYTFRVEAIDPQGHESAGGPTVKVHSLPDKTPPEWGRTGLETAALSDTGVLLQWDQAWDNDRVDGYNVYLDGTRLAQVPAPTNPSRGRYEVTGLTPATTYTMEVRAYDRSGNETPNGPTVTVTTRPAGAGATPPALKYRDGWPMLQLSVQRGDKTELFSPDSFSPDGITFAFASADSYHLVGTLTEPAASMTGNAPVTSISTYDADFYASFNPPLDGSSATLNLDAYDKAGNKGSLPPITVRLLPGPTVSITSPAIDGAVVGQSGVITLAGTISSPAWKVEVINLDWPHQSFWAASRIDGLHFTAELHLPAAQDGVYHVRAVAENMEHLRSLPNPSGDDVRTITVDALPPGAPGITSPQPTNGSIVSPTSSITITGNAEPLSTVSVSGNLKAAPVQADTSGLFNMTMTVPGGKSCFSLIATDLAGNASPGTPLCLVRDGAPPVLQTLSVAYDTAKGRREISSATPTISVDRADRYELRATFNEAIASAKVNGNANGVTFPSNTALSVSLQGLKVGTNTVPVEVADLAGNTTKLNLSLTVIADPNTPVVTVTSATKFLAGAPAPGSAATAITVTGMASKPLKNIQLVNATDGSLTDLAVTANIDMRNPTRWTARLQIPPTGVTWALRVVGIDSAGNASYPGVKDTVTVVSDPVGPDLAVDLSANLTAGDQLYLLTDGDDPTLHVVNRRLTVKGTATDGQSGVAGVTVAGTKLNVSGAPGSWTFNTAVSLREGVVTPVSVTGLDVAGNSSKPYQMNVLMRTVVNRLQVSAKWTKTTGLTVSGLTDAAIKLPSGLVGVIPIEVVIGDKFRHEFSRHTLVTDGVEYNPATGAFKLAVDTSFMGPGEYMVTVKTKPPAEFPGLATKTQVLTFIIGK